MYVCTNIFRLCDSVQAIRIVNFKFESPGMHLANEAKPLWPQHGLLQLQNKPGDHDQLVCAAEEVLFGSECLASVNRGTRGRSSLYPYLDVV